VDIMLDDIKPLANNVLLNIIKKCYPDWYSKRISIQYPENVSIYLFIFVIIFLFYININIIFR
jgi:hypothetical protein